MSTDASNTSSASNPQPSRLEVHRTVISESRFPNKLNLDTIAKHLRAIRAIGKLTVNFSQGGVSSVTFESRHSLNGSDHVEIRFDSE
jgi:hypothetical protein